MTAQPRGQVRFRRAIERRALRLAEDAAGELPNLSLEDALQLFHLYAERGYPKFEPRQTVRTRRSETASRIAHR